MPKDKPEVFVEEQPIQDMATRLDSRPLRVRVVYMGAKRNMSVCLKGSILTENYEQADGPMEYRDRDSGTMRRGIQLRKVVEGGMTSYDFSTHDLKGNLIRDRMIPNDHPQEDCRNKRFEWVEHPGHVAQFHLGPKDHDRKRQKGEFKVLAAPADQAFIQQIVERVRRRENRRAVELEEVLKG